MSQQLRQADLNICLSKLPQCLLNLLGVSPNRLVVAGGFVRACVAGETPSDVDVFLSEGSRVDASHFLARQAASFSTGEPKISNTDRTSTVWLPCPVQFCDSWTFEDPDDLLTQFDFTVTTAAFWWDGRTWASTVGPFFYNDVAAKRLRYSCPDRVEVGGESLLRLLKFYRRGYTCGISDLGALVAHLVSYLGGDEEVVRENVTKLLRDSDTSSDSFKDPPYLKE